MDYKQAFLSQLENSYLGVQIQDSKDLFSQDLGSKEAFKKSGFINLLQMKSKYFQHIKNLLEKEKLNHSIYTKLYNFFSSYLNETGTPFFYDTPMHKNIYAKVYTNSKDTSLFYKTQNLYYVKSDTLYHDAEITSQDSKYTFIFDTSHFIPNADNAKNKAIFKFTIEENIRIYVLNDKESLKELPNVFKQNSSDLSDEFIKSLKDKKIQLQEEEIKKILSSYKKQNEIDFFIHKNARAFLQEQFNLWLCNYVLDDITQWRQEKIEELNTLKKVAFSIIDYIADFEDELKAIWCKPKFAKKVEYVFSLDVILKNSSLEGHSVLSDKSGNLHSNFRSFASSKLPQSSLDNPLFSSQSLECQKDGEKNVSCIADTKTQQSLTQDTRIADTCHSERSEESKTTQAQQSSLRENKQSAVSLENPQDFRGKTSQQRSFFSNLKSSTTESQTLLDSIVNDKGFESQVKEWQELKLVEEDISLDDMKSMFLSLQKLSNESSAICHSKAVTEESFSPRHSELHSSEESKSNTRDSKKDVSGGHPQHDENEKYRYLPLDTKHFNKATKYKILSSFKDIESTLNGELIKSDNFQALNTLLPKYQNKVDLIYIDPPYNAPASEIIYKNNFKDSTWLAMMANRLDLAKEFLSERGILSCAIDENEQENLGLLLSDIFYEYEKTCVSVRHNPKGIQGGFIAQNNEFAYFLSPEKAVSNNKLLDKKEWKYDHLRNWGGESERHTAKNCFYPIYVKDSKIIGFGVVCKEDFHPQANMLRDDGVIEVYPIDSSGVERKWTYARQSIESIWENLKIEEDKNGIISIKKPITEVRFKTIWEDSVYIAGDYGSKILTNILPNNNFDYPKSIHTVKDSIYLASKEDSTILDFFGGSGTTAHAVLELNREGGNRKFVLVEMGEHFYYVIIPRIKKVAFSQEWKNGELKNGKQVNPISIAFRYYELESYEESLSNCEYVLDKDSIIDYRKSRKLIKGLKKDEAINLDMNGYRKDFDILHTMANVLGLKIQRLFLDSKGIECAEFDNGDIVSSDSVDLCKYPKLTNLIWWER